MRLSLFAGLVLTTCAPAPVGPAFRQPSAPIYSNAALDLDRMAGRWAEVAAFAPTGAPACAPAGVQISRATDGLAIAGTLCLAGRRVPVSGALVSAGPGRFALRGGDPKGIGQVWWVLWADVDYRTLVIGTPSGAFGFILNRGGALPPDRATAARDLLEFNGYDPAQLVAVAL